MQTSKAGFATSFLAVLAVALSSCGGRSSDVPQSSSQPLDSVGSRARPMSTGAPPTPSTPPPTPALHGWLTYQYNNQRTGHNPNSLNFTSAAINAGKLHRVWHASFNDVNTQTQPIEVAGLGPNGHPLLIVGGGSGNAYGYDAFTGTQVWKTFLGQLTFGCNGATSGHTFGVEGTAVYDGSGSVYVPDGQGSTPQINGDPAGGTAYVYKLDAATGAIIGKVAIAPSPLPAEAPNAEIDFVHTGLTLANGLLYAGISSPCDITPWRGRLVAVDPGTMTLAATFFTTFGQGANYGGGGVWGWGGASVAPSGSVYIGTGNADDSKPQPAPYVAAPDEDSAYAEHVVKLSSNLAYEASRHPDFTYGDGPQDVDLDFAGTPVLFAPTGCSLIAASQGKAGKLEIYDAALTGKPLAHFLLSAPSFNANYAGNPAYSPQTNLLYAAVASAMGVQYAPGMVAIAPGGHCSSFDVVWHTAFGPDSFASTGSNPRSAPTVTAGGVVFMGTPYGNPIHEGALWALDATTGALLNGGVPLLQTPANIRMAPVVDGDWLWVIDQHGNLYGFSLDPAYGG